MTKTVEEGVLDIIWQYVKHFYHNDFLPWNQRRNEHGGQHHGLRDRTADDIYFALPLSVEETGLVDDQHAHQHYLLNQGEPDGLNRPRLQQHHNAIFEQPEFLRNRVGVTMEHERPGFSRIPPSPVFIDRANRQVLLSHDTLWHMIDMIPWGSQRSNLHQGGQVGAGNNNESSSDCVNRQNAEDVSLPESLPSRTIEPSQVQMPRPPVSRVLKVLSANLHNLHFRSNQPVVYNAELMKQLENDFNSNKGNLATDKMPQTSTQARSLISRLLKSEPIKRHASRTSQLPSESRLFGDMGEVSHTKEVQVKY